MKIKLKEVTVRFLTNCYINNDENGVTGCNGQLNIRPKYQREFVYKPKQQEAVINTVRNDFPLNTMYWVKNSEGGYEVLDGQQRTISICEYVEGNFSVDYQYFHNLEQDEQEQILNYKLMVYYCEGEDSEKLEWFETINIAGEKLTKQELRNAIYTGPWLTDAKRHFSKTGCPVHSLGSDYLKGSSIRQDYLETTIKWISEGNIEDYMSANQHELNANELWLYFQKVVAWVKTIFPKHRAAMKMVDWGYLYNNHKDDNLDADLLEIEVKRLLLDKDVTSKKGVWPYLITDDERHLNIRKFDENDRIEAYERQDGICPVCQEHFKIEDMDADHITKWSDGGLTIASNCRMLCAKDNRSAIKSSDFKIAPDWLSHQREFLRFFR